MTDDDPRPDALALADRFDARAARLEAEAADLRHKAAVLRGTVGEATADVEAARERAGLTIGDERSKIRHNMQASKYAEHARKTGRPPESGHPFVEALSSRNLSVRQWAEAHKLTRAKVASWMLDGDGGRRIPRKYADEIAKDFKVPISAWRNGIRED